MLHLLPSEILVMIVNTPSMYYNMSQVVPFGRNVVQYFMAKFAPMVHKKKFSTVLSQIHRNEARYEDCYNVLTINTKKNFRMEPDNWIEINAWNSNTKMFARIKPSHIMVMTKYKGVDDCTIVLMNKMDREFICGKSVICWAPCYLDQRGIELLESWD